MMNSGRPSRATTNSMPRITGRPTQHLSEQTPNQPIPPLNRKITMENLRYVAHVDSETELANIRRQHSVHNNKLKQSGKRHFYCKDIKKYKCTYQLIAVCHNDGKFSAYSKGLHDHSVPKEGLNHSAGMDQSIETNPMGSTSAFQLDSMQRRDSSASTAAPSTPSVVKTETHEETSNDDTDPTDTSTPHASIGLPRAQLFQLEVKNETSSGSHSQESQVNELIRRAQLAQGIEVTPTAQASQPSLERQPCFVLAENVNALQTLALELNLNLESSGEDATMMFMSTENHLCGKLLMLTDEKERVNVSEFHDFKFNRAEHWQKADWPQFYRAVRGLCVEYFK